MKGTGKYDRSSRSKGMAVLHLAAGRPSPDSPAMLALADTDAGSALPPLFAAWFASRGWQPRAHQLALLGHAARGKSVLLVAPTGGGKTLAGFLPSLIELAALPARQGHRKSALHTLYISPLKAL